jgi:hypothetical protein
MSFGPLHSSALRDGLSILTHLYLNPLLSEALEDLFALLDLFNKVARLRPEALSAKFSAGSISMSAHPVADFDRFIKGSSAPFLPAGD